MYSSSSWKPSPSSITTSLVSNYVGKENNSYRKRGSTEEFLRTISSLTPTTTTINASSEIAEIILHKDIEAQQIINKELYKTCIKNGWTDEQAKDLIFDRCIGT